MEAIIVAIISGFFSLAGIWYQNYLMNKSNIRHAGNLSLIQDKTKPSIRILFSILIAILPWIIWKFSLFELTKTIYKYMDTYAKIMVAYFAVWLIITVIAIFSGWKLKTFFEKIILIVSSILLLYWCMWMIIVHNLA